jgi:predicted transcriptional regulator
VVRRLRPSEALRRLDIIAERRAQARRRLLEEPLGDLLDPAGRGHAEVVHRSDEDSAPDADAPDTSR